MDASERDVIREATAGDADALLSIYAPYVRDTAITFEYEPPTREEFAGRIAALTPEFPWLVYEDGARGALGYAYATTWRTRAAYRWTVETTVYVATSAHRRGIGRALYTSLLACLRLQGHRLAIGGITLPNAGSVALHERCGFRLVGVHRACGYKQGAWHDVAFYELPLGPQDAATPPPPATARELAGRPAWQGAIRSGLSG